MPGAALADVVLHVPDCLAAAWIDGRTGELLDRHVASHANVDGAVETVIEIIRSAERPQQLVLLGAQLVYIARRVNHDGHRVLVVVCERSSNLGMACAMVRAHTEASDLGGGA